MHLTKVLGSPWLSQLLESQAKKRISALNSVVVWHQGKENKKELRTIRELVQADEPVSPKSTIFRATSPRAVPRAAPTIIWITQVCMFVREIMVSLGEDKTISVTAAAANAYEGKSLWASHSKLTRTVFLRALTLLPSRDVFDSNMGVQSQRLLCLGEELSGHVDILIDALPVNEKALLLKVSCANQTTTSMPKA